MGPSGKGHCKLLYGDWGIDEEVELEEFHDYSSRSETDIVNVVEQRIWHSMEEGHFENLPGKGKPLDLSTNPHADPAEDTLYRILSKNGCAPEWVELNKEIRRKITEWRLAMKKLWADRSNHDDDSKWIQDYETLKPQVREINDMIFKAEFNCPCWFSTSTKKLIKRILDPNPITRITISKVIGNEWFKKGYQSPSFETPDIDIDDVQAIFDAEPSNYIVKRREEKPVLMNAFELISTSQGLNLGSLFEKQMGLVKRETRFWITVKLKLIDGDKSKAIGIVGDLHLGATFEDFEACTIGFSVPSIHGGHMQCCLGLRGISEHFEL